MTNTEAQEVNIRVLHWDLLATVVHFISGENGVSDLHYAASYLQCQLCFTAQCWENCSFILGSWAFLLKQPLLLFGLWAERMLCVVINGVCVKDGGEG